VLQYSFTNPFLKEIFMSKAIITLTDSSDGIDVNLEFDPPAAANGYISGAQWLAGEMLKVAAKLVKQSYDDEEAA
jgi:hypothetical protein